MMMPRLRKEVNEANHWRIMIKSIIEVKIKKQKKTRSMKKSDSTTTYLVTTQVIHSFNFLQRSTKYREIQESRSKFLL